MSARIFVLLAVLIVVVSAAAVPTVHSQSSEVEVRVAAQRLDDGRTEFALQERQADGAWGERRLPRSRFFPASATVDRWLASSALSVAGVEVRIATRLVADGRMEFALQERQADGEWGERRLPRSRFFPAGAAVGRWLASSALTVRAPTLDVDVDVDVVQVEVRIATQLVLDGRMEFALQERQADGEWGERRLPRSRFFPATPAVGRWLASSALTVSAPGAGSDAVGVEVRLAAQRVADGRTEFALQERQADGAWGERQLPRSRFFPASATVGRWLASSPLTLSVPAAAPSPPVDTPSPPVTVPAAPGTPESERAALVAFYEATDGENWTDSTNWLSDRPIGEWHGVATPGDGRVGVLTLTNNGLSGPIPARLGELTDLAVLFLAGNELIGEIPAELGGLSNVRLLNLSSNSLTGSIPAALGELANLQLLFLGGNPLGGCVPEGLWDVRGDAGELGLPFCEPSAGAPAPTFAEALAIDRAALVALYNATNGPNWNVNTNWLTDMPVRDWHGVTTDGAGYVTGVRLARNELSGSIPGELGNLAYLRMLDLSGNFFFGPIPGELGSLVYLESLQLARGSLTGSIPAQLGGLRSLTYLDLANNELTGPIPASLGQLTRLTSLSLHLNRLSGPIPAELGDLTNLRELGIGSNELSGPIPAELGGLTNLSRMLLFQNRLSGPIPPELGNLANLDTLTLIDNELSGPIPEELSSLTNLRELDLDGNELSGPIPRGLGDLNRLRSLGLARNRLTGAIPAELGSLTNLQSLSLAGNELGGPLPVELGSLPNLSALTLRITLDGNEFTGCIPDGLRDVERNNLHRLALRYCGTPDVPPPASDWPVLLALYDTMGGGATWKDDRFWLSEVPIGSWHGVTTGSSGRVTSLSLDDNDLSGPIPGELLAKLTNLEWLLLHNNNLSGPIRLSSECSATSFRCSLLSTS